MQKNNTIRPLGHRGRGGAPRKENLRRKASAYDSRSAEAARIILADPLRYPPGSLMERLARREAAAPQPPAVDKRTEQRLLFGTGHPELIAEPPAVAGGKE